MRCQGRSPNHHFNSQPREGGWHLPHLKQAVISDFNSQPREGGWVKRLGSA